MDRQGLSLNEILNLDIHDVMSNLLAQEKFIKEEKSCETKQEQIDFMYKHYSAGRISPRKLAQDYDEYQYTLACMSGSY